VTSSFSGKRATQTALPALASLYVGTGRSCETGDLLGHNTRTVALGAIGEADSARSTGAETAATRTLVTGLGVAVGHGGHGQHCQEQHEL